MNPLFLFLLMQQMGKKDASAPTAENKKVGKLRTFSKLPKKLQDTLKKAKLMNLTNQDEVLLASINSGALPPGGAVPASYTQFPAAQNVPQAFQQPIPGAGGPTTLIIDPTSGLPQPLPIGTRVLTPGGNEIIASNVLDTAQWVAQVTPGTLFTLPNGAGQWVKPGGAPAGISLIPQPTVQAQPPFVQPPVQAQPPFVQPPFAPAQPPFVQQPPVVQPPVVQPPVVQPPVVQPPVVQPPVVQPQPGTVAGGPPPGASAGDLALYYGLSQGIPALFNLGGQVFDYFTGNGNDAEPAATALPDYSNIFG